jgi:hypothetical protein
VLDSLCVNYFRGLVNLANSLGCASILTVGQVSDGSGLVDPIHGGQEPSDLDAVVSSAFMLWVEQQWVRLNSFVYDPMLVTTYDVVHYEG